MAIETKAAAETAIRAIVLIIMKIVGTTAQIAIRGTDIRSATKIKDTMIGITTGVMTTDEIA